MVFPVLTMKDRNIPSGVSTSEGICSIRIEFFLSFIMIGVRYSLLALGTYSSISIVLFFDNNPTG